MIIRKAVLKDANEILHILKTTPELQGAEGGDIYDKKYVIGAIKKPDRDLVLVAIEENKIIGILMAELWKDKGYSYFCELFVVPEYRKTGVASKLFSEYENILKKLKIKAITAMVLTTNKRMQKWCAKKGIKQCNKMYLYEKELK